jgi:hypothetical protein
MDWYDRRGVVMDCRLIRTIRMAQNAEILRSRKPRTRTQPPTDTIQEAVNLDSKGNAEGVLVDSLPW